MESAVVSQHRHWSYIYGATFVQAHVQLQMLKKKNLVKWCIYQHIYNVDLQSFTNKSFIHTQSKVYNKALCLAVDLNF